MSQTRQAISTDQAPKAIGPYSQAVRVGDTVYLSGQIGFDPRTMEIVSGGVEAETRRVFENIKAVVAAAGGSMAHICKVTIFLADMADFPKVNEIMAQHFSEPYPARSTFAVAALPRGARVEVECVLSLA
ncbi:MAG TPA: RidA family protein [Steroidobacteraceae bacterium]|nr:RidA family protein [Steroidobacteraceae bacterium]HRX88374.1 RidA family protein [Steroidobacteraceae bacterium]